MEADADEEFPDDDGMVEIIEWEADAMDEDEEWVEDVIVDESDDAIPADPDEARDEFETWVWSDRHFPRGCGHVSACAALRTENRRE